MLNFLFIFAFGLVFSVSFAPGTKESQDDNDNCNTKPISDTVNNESGVDGELERELTDAELRKIVAEQPLDDPLNAFYDPYEPYRLSTFAYWHPITFPKEHSNPPLPVGFLPPNAPPKSFPSDFFFRDDDAQRIVLGEHAASFCPFLRRWREKNPLKPYPIEADFLRRHVPIKFTPGKGYEIDHELKKINDLTRKAEEEIMKEAELENQSAQEKVNNDDDEGEKLNNPKQEPLSQEQKQPKTEEPQKQPQANSMKEEVNGNSSPNAKIKKGKRKSRKVVWELNILMDVIRRVMNARPDCRNYAKFLERPLPTVHYLSTPPDCLQEVVFYMDELEDVHNPVKIEDNLPEIINKVEFYRHILVKLYEFKIGKKKKKGKCPFGFKSKKEAVNDSVKIYKGSIPKWAESKPGEEIYTSDADSKWENVDKYRFAYKQVPFPSIQDTLKKYVSI
jgi:hypothetical protein